MPLAPYTLTALHHRLTGLTRVEPAAEGAIAETIASFRYTVDAAGTRTR